MEPEPTFEELLDWLEGRLDPIAADDVVSAIEAGRSSTINAVRWIESFHAESRNQELIDVPPWLRARLRRLIEAHVADGRPGQRTVLADLSFDSRLGGELVGVRGPPSETSQPELEPFHLIFRADDFEIVLEARPTAGAFRLDGQILSRRSTVEAWLATVEHPGGHLRSSPSDDLGCFSVAPVPPDATRMVLDNGQLVIVMPLELGSTGRG
jgi:hypothetical protein